MTPRTSLLFIGLAGLVACPKSSTVPSPATQETPVETAMTYPEAPKGDVITDYFGTSVADPYRWLEDPDSEATRAWIDAENALTQEVLGAIPGRAGLKKRLGTLWNYERYGVPHQKGGKYFLSHNDGLQDQSVLYVLDSLDGEKRALIDPSTLSEDGTVSLSGYSVSKDAKYIAWGSSDGGSDWNTYRVRDVATGADLEDVVQWVKFSEISWMPDNSGFFYGRYPEAENPLEAKNENYQLYFHQLGTPQADDVVVFESPENPEWGFGNTVTEDGKTLVISVWQGTEEKNRVYLKSLDALDKSPVKVLDAFDAYYTYLGNEGDLYWFQTNNDAPRGRVIQVDLSKPDPSGWVEIVPHSEQTLEGASFTGGTLFVSYLEDAHSVVRVFDKTGQPKADVPLPGLGSAGGFGGGADATETFFYYTNFTTPTALYRYQIASGEVSVYKTPEVGFNSDDYETKQVFYSSKDGTKIPMFITHKKGLEPNGQTPTLLYGYGGFNISITPSFKVANVVWMEMGGIYAVANIRGGGEYGQAWHDAGTKLTKQNVFDDFIAAGEYLVSEGYTNPDKLAISGRSNGGLLVGATLLQRPDLFAAALPGVGVLDMLRYHTWTIGWAWASDYGTSEDSEEMFKALYAYSPVHNAKSGTEYPATMIITADHDDRVVPAHSFKFAAALQAAQAGSNPTIIRIDTRAGHGAGTPTSMKIEQATDEWSFLMNALGEPLPYE